MYTPSSYSVTPVRNPGLVSVKSRIASASAVAISIILPGSLSQ